MFNTYQELRLKDHEGNHASHKMAALKKQRARVMSLMPSVKVVRGPANPRTLI